METSPEKFKALIKQSQKGNVQAFGRIFDIYAASLYRFFFWRLRDKSEAEDLVHEVFLSAWRSLPRYRAKRGAKFSSWLFAIARRRLIDSIRKKRVTVSWEKVGFANNPQLQWQAAIDEEAHFRAVMAALPRLSKIEREVLSLRFIEDWPVKEVAETLKFSESNVRQISFRAIRKLRKVLGINNE